MLEMAPYFLWNAYLAKFDTLGNRIWATYLGNDSTTYQPSITLDKEGNIVVAGLALGFQNLMGTPGTYLPTLPTANFQSGYGYVIKFDPDGQHLWGTYIYHQNTNNIENNVFFYPNTCTTDDNGNILIGGMAMQRDTSAAGNYYYSFPSTNTFMPAPHSQADGFIIKLSSNGNFLWGTYVGGEKMDGVNHLACNANGDIYVLGNTESQTNLATPGASFQNYSANAMIGNYESFIIKLNANGQRLWGTYTNGSTANGGLVLNENDEFYIAGSTTRDTGIATPGTWQTQYQGEGDFFLSKWNSDGQRLWSTYYGGESYEFEGNGNAPYPMGILAMRHNLSLNALGNILIAGSTRSKFNIRMGCTYWPPIEKEGFIAKFYPDGKLMWGSYFDAGINAIAAANQGESFYMVTSTAINNLTTPGSFQSTKSANGFSGYIVKMNGDFTCPDSLISLNQQGDSLILSNNYHDY